MKGLCIIVTREVSVRSESEQLWRQPLYILYACVYHIACWKRQTARQVLMVKVRMGQWQLNRMKLVCSLDNASEKPGR